MFHFPEQPTFGNTAYTDDAQLLNLNILLYLRFLVKKRFSNLWVFCAKI